MEKSFQQTSEKVSTYVHDLMHPEDKILQEIRERSQKAGLPGIQVGKMDALHLEVLTRAMAAKKIVEIGTLGGYSGVCLVRGTGTPAGKLYTFEYNAKHADVARESFRLAGVSQQVQIFVGPALENLPKIEKEGPFDLVFIDADKANYVNYLRWAEKNLRVGGAILADNTFAWGLIGESDLSNHKDDEKSVRALQEFNSALAKNRHFRTTMLPTGEGLTLAVKVSE